MKLPALFSTRTRIFFNSHKLFISLALFFVLISVFVVLGVSIFTRSALKQQELVTDFSSFIGQRIKVEDVDFSEAGYLNARALDLQSRNIRVPLQGFTVVLLPKDREKSGTASAYQLNKQGTEVEFLNDKTIIIHESD